MALRTLHMNTQQYAITSSEQLPGIDTSGKHGQRRGVPMDVHSVRNAMMVHHDVQL